jgi:putative transcriptional regulator
MKILGIYDGIKKGLQEAIDYSDGKLDVRKNKITIAPMRNYQAADIRELRVKTRMTQSLFAEFMGVSTKTVEAWERGTNIPIGPARRILGLVEQDPSLPERFGIVLR